MPGLVSPQRKIGHREFGDVFLAFPALAANNYLAGFSGAQYRFLQGGNLPSVVKHLGSFPAFFKRFNFSTDGKDARSGFLC